MRALDDYLAEEVLSEIDSRVRRDVEAKPAARMSPVVRCRGKKRKRCDMPWNA